MEQPNSEKSIIVHINELSCMPPMPPQVVAVLCVKNVPVLSQTYISELEYEKIKEEKKKLESQVEGLQIQIMTNEHLRQELQTKIDGLLEQIKEFKQQLTEKSKQMEAMSKE